MMGLRNTLVTAAVGALVAGGLLSLLAGPKQTSVASASSPMEDSDANALRMQREIEALGRDLRRLRDDANRPSIAASAETLHDAPPVSNPPVTETERPVLSQAEIGEQAQELFDGESRDGSWAATEEAMIATQIGAVLPKGSYLKSHQCKASICRIETEHRSSSDYNDFIHSTFLNPNSPFAHSSGMTSVVSDSGTKFDSTIYMGRERPARSPSLGQAPR